MSARTWSFSVPLTIKFVWEQFSFESIMLSVCKPFELANYQGMRRATEGRVMEVDLLAGRAPAGETEITDPLVCADAVEDEGGSRIEASRRAQVIGAAIESLGRHAHADQPVRGASGVPPQPAALAAQA